MIVTIITERCKTKTNGKAGTLELTPKVLVTTIDALGHF